MNKSIKETALNNLHFLYGEAVDERITSRLNKELESLEQLNKLDVIENVVDIINKKKNKGELILPRLSLSNSFLLYLLGINNVNPLPRHTYCPMCHTFYWGNKKEGICGCCGEPLKEDGYDLDYELFIKDIEKSHSYPFSTSGKDEEIEDVKFISLFELELAKQLGLSQEEIDRKPEDADKVLSHINSLKFDFECKKQDLIHHDPFIGLYDLSNSLIERQCRHYKNYSFDGVVKILSMNHSSGLVAANAKLFRNIDDCITSRDDLYAFLKRNQFNSDDAYTICKETRANGEGHLSYSSEEKLKDAQVDKKYITLIKATRYTFHKGHVVSFLKLLVNLGKIYLEEPKRYYDAYFYLNKDIYDSIDKDGDLIDGVINSKSTEQEKIYLGLIDLKERL